MGLLYNFIKFTGRVALPVFYGRLDIQGRPYIPYGSPCILVANHQAAFLDSILLGSMHLQPLHFLARSDIFQSRSEWILAKFNMMPIYRMRDGYQQLSKNEEVFQKCDHLLKSDGHILIYPEASMKMVHYVRPLAKGAARMAFQAQEKLEKDLYILPVGLSYYHHFEARYKCILRYGPAIRVRDYQDLSDTNPAKALIALRDDMSTRMKDLLLIPDMDGCQVKSKSLHRGTERYTFDEMCSLFQTNRHVEIKSYPWLRPLTVILSIFNPLSIGLSRWLLGRIGDPQFSTSIKYITGLIGSMIWWTVLFVLGSLIYDWHLGVALVILSLTTLIWREDLKKWMGKAPYPSE